jgi:type II secretory pathway component GspD/PulD (secretin)
MHTVFARLMVALACVGCSLSSHADILEQAASLIDEVHGAPEPAVVDQMQEETTRLATLPAVRIPIHEAPLHTAVSLLAAASGLSFISPDADLFAESLTLDVTGSPWELLNVLGRRYAFEMRTDSGVWTFHRAGGEVAVAETHRLRHANLDTFTADQSVVSTPGGETGSTGPVFSLDPGRISEDLNQLLGPDSGARIVHIPSANSLLVVARPSQQAVVRAYLEAVDRPPHQIRIEARFVETSHDPSLLMGVEPADWQPSVSLTEMTSRWDMNRVDSLRLPTQALFSADKLAFHLRMLRTDDRSRIVNQPVVTTLENREVYLSVGAEEPFAAASLTNTAAAGSPLTATQSSVAFRRVGTSINVLPVVFESATGQPVIRLTVQVEVGVLSGFRKVGESSVPRVQSQRYTFTVLVPEGRTLVFGGLAGAEEQEGVSEVPFLSEIPVAGSIFRSRKKSSGMRNLVAYITPHLVDATTADREPEPAVLPPSVRELEPAASRNSARSRMRTD